MKWCSKLPIHYLKRDKGVAPINPGSCSKLPIHYLKLMKFPLLSKTYSPRSKLPIHYLKPTAN